MTISKKTFFGILLIALSAAAAGVVAKEQKEASAPAPMQPPIHTKITDPKIYIPLRENMTEMELKFVDIQILAAADTIDFKAIQLGLEHMEKAAKKIRSINPKENMREPLQQLSERLDGLKRDVRRKNADALKADLDRLFQTCFKCHQAHAPLMKSE